jgi:hypothetical protein
MKLKHIVRSLSALKEKKNAVGRVGSIGLTIHVDSVWDGGSKQLTVTVTNQATKAPEYIIPDVESEDKVQEIVSGLESELGAACKSFSKSVDKILAKYQK